MPGFSLPAHSSRFSLRVPQWESFRSGLNVLTTWQVQCPHDADARHHGRAIELDDQEQGFDRGVPLLEMLLGLGKPPEIVRGVLEGDEVATAGQGNAIVEGVRPGHLKASNKPGRVTLVCRIVSLRPFTAFIATHSGAKLVERHGAEHRDPLAEHPERHPDRSLAALAADPGITFGLELGDSSVVCHPCIKARSKRERTSFRPRSIPGAAYGLREFFS